MSDPDDYPTPRRLCPFDGEARRRIAVLKAEARHTRETLDKIARDVERITLDIACASFCSIQKMAE